jgi:hypothetical protein
MPRTGILRALDHLPGIGRLEQIDAAQLEH